MSYAARMSDSNHLIPPFFYKTSSCEIRPFSSYSIKCNVLRRNSMILFSLWILNVSLTLLKTVLLKVCCCNRPFKSGPKSKNIFPRLRSIVLLCVLQKIKQKKASQVSLVRKCEIELITLSWGNKCVCCGDQWHDVGRGRYLGCTEYVKALT